jgi:non-ribosomal peptide synthetase component F
LLQRFSNQDDVIIGTVVDNRDSPESASLAGPLASVLPMCIDASGNPSLLELLRRAREVVMRAYENREVPFDALAEILQQGSCINRRPPFQAMLILDETPLKPLRLPEPAFIPEEVGGAAAKCDLALLLADEGGQITGSLRYNASAFEANTIALLLEKFTFLLEAIVKRPEQTLLDLPLFNADCAAYPGAGADPHAANDAEDQFSF